MTWRAISGRQLRWVERVAVGADGTLASAAADNTVRLWDVSGAVTAEAGSGGFGAGAAGAGGHTSVWGTGGRAWQILLATTSNAF